MVTFNPTSISVTVPAFYITVNGSQTSTSISNYASLNINVYDVAGHKVQIEYYNSDPSSGSPTATYIIAPASAVSIPSSGTYSDSYTIEHHDYATMKIWVQAFDSTDAVSSNTVVVTVAAPVITTVNWWFYDETLGIETELAGYGAKSNTYEVGSPGGGTNFGVRGQVLDSKGNGINGVSVSITGFATSPFTDNSHTDSKNGAIGMFDTGAQTIPKNTSTSLATHTISVSV